MNAGTKVLGVSRAIFMINMLISVLGGGIVLIVGIAEDITGMIVTGAVLFVVGWLFSYILKVMMDAFGQAVCDIRTLQELALMKANSSVKTSKPEAKSDMIGSAFNDAVNNRTNADTNDNDGLQVQKPQSEKSKSDDNTWIDEENGFVICPGCGERMSIDFIRARKKCPSCGQAYVSRQQ